MSDWPTVTQQLGVTATTGTQTSNPKSFHYLFQPDTRGFKGCKMDLDLWVVSCCIHFASLFFLNCCFPLLADHWERNTILSLCKGRDKLRTGKGNQTFLGEGQMGGGYLWPTWMHKVGAPPNLPQVLPHQLLGPLHSPPFPFSPKTFLCLIKVQLSAGIQGLL